MCQEYAIPHLSTGEQSLSSSFLSSHTPLRPPPPLQNFLPKPPPVPPPPEQYYAASEICPPPPTPNSPPNPAPSNKISSLFMLPLSPDLDDLSHEEDDPDIIEFSRESLRIIDDFGESYYGPVHLCELQRSPPKMEFSACSFVSVNFLQHENLRADFIREARTIAKLKDVNVAQLVGACLGSDPLCIVREYGEFGDLCQFLQDHIADSTIPRPPSANTLR